MSRQTARMAATPEQGGNGPPTGGSKVPPRELWWLAGGFGVWCSALVVLYALQAIGCTFAWPTGTLRLSLVAVFLGHLLLIGWMWAHLVRTGPDSGCGSTGSVLHTVFVWTTISAFVATVLTLGLPLLLSTCI